MENSWVPKRYLLQKDIEKEKRKLEWWEKPFEPFKWVGQAFASPFLADEEMRQETEQRENERLRLLREARERGDKEAEQALYKQGAQQAWGAFQPGGELRERYEELPVWQQILAETPGYLATGGITGTGLRATLAGTARGTGAKATAARVARGALLPAEKIELAPGAALSKIGKKLGLGAPKLQNQLPHTMPELSPTKVRKQTKVVAKELSDYLGAEPLKVKPITRATLKRPPQQKLADAYSGFVNRTYRIEPMLLKADKYVEGGKMHQAFWRPVNAATDQKLSGIYKGIDSFRNVLKTNKIALNKLLIETVETDGRVLTRGERIGIALHSENADNIVHVVFGNDIPVPTMNKIVASLTPEEKAVANYLRDYFAEQTPMVGKIVKQVTGKPMDVVEKYFPIRLERKALALGEAEFNQIVIDERKLRYGSKWASSKIRKGFTLPRTGRAMQPVELDAVHIFIKHMEGVEHYKAFTPVIRDLQGLLANPTLHRAIVQKEGLATHQVLEQWLKDVAQTNPLRVNSQMEGILRGLRVNAVTAVLGLNITTALKQFPSFVSGMAEVGEMAALRGLFTIMRHPKQTNQLIKQYAPQIYKRTFERELAEAKVLKSLEKQVMGKYSPRELFMIMTTTMDKLAVNSLWRGGFDDALRQGLSTKDAAEYATRGIRRTQPFFSVKDVPEYWRSGEFAKALTIFTNQLNQYWNYYRFHIVGKAAAGKISKPEVIRRVMETFIVPALMIGAVSRSRPAQDAKEFTEDLSSMATATIPIWGKIISSGLRGWQSGSDLITTELMERVGQASYQINKGEWDKLAQLAPEMVGYAAGIPVAQPRRTIDAILSQAESKSDDWMELIWGKYVREQAREKPQGSIWERARKSGGNGSIWERAKKAQR